MTTYCLQLSDSVALFFGGLTAFSLKAVTLKYLLPCFLDFNQMSHTVLCYKDLLRFQNHKFINLYLSFLSRPFAKVCFPAFYNFFI